MKKYILIIFIVLIMIVPCVAFGKSCAYINEQDSEPFKYILVTKSSTIDMTFASNVDESRIESVGIEALIQSQGSCSTSFSGRKEEELRCSITEKDKEIINMDDLLLKKFEEHFDDQNNKQCPEEFYFYSKKNSNKVSLDYIDTSKKFIPYSRYNQNELASCNQQFDSSCSEGTAISCKKYTYEGTWSGQRTNTIKYIELGNRLTKDCSVEMYFGVSTDNFGYYERYDNILKPAGRDKIKYQLDSSTIKTNGQFIEENELKVCKKNDRSSNDELYVFYKDGVEIDNCDLVDVYVDNPDIEKHDCVSLLGDPNHNGKPNEKGIVYPASPAYYLSFVFKLMRWAAIIILIVMSILEFTGATASGDEDQLQKVIKRTGIRLALCVLIFIIPEIIEYILKIINDNSIKDCINFDM